MKALLSLTLICSLPSVAAEFPAANDRIADCEDQWFLLEGRDPGSRILGFAYVDPTVGVTIEHNGDVSVAPDGSLERKPFELKDKARLIMRVTANYEVACLTEAQRTQLGIPATPDWLGFYKDSRAAGPHNVAWASHYNHIGAFDRALKYIEAARSESFESRDLTFEHGFSLNAMERYQEARVVLEPGVRSYPRDVNIRAELGFAHLGLGEFAEAIEIYERAYSMDKDGASGRRAEFAQNIAAACARLGNERAAAKWHALAQETKPKQ
jgi:tetratricopeptide (TPR) repeat protein